MTESLQSRVKRLDNAVHHGGLRSDRITLIVMHTTEGGSAQSSIDYMNKTADKTASYHYLIDRSGDILRMTMPTLVAYHAGDSWWPDPVPQINGKPDRPNGGKSVNRCSVGIAWANRNGEPLTDAQIESALWLCATFCKDYRIPVANVIGHRECSPGRKSDPLPSVMRMDEWRALLTNHIAR